METATAVRLALSSATAVLSLTTIVYSLVKRKKTLLIFFFICFQATGLLLSFRFFIETFHIFDAGGLLFIVFQYLPGCFYESILLLFSLVYTNSKIIQDYKKILVLFSLPVLCYIMVLTNKYHHLFFGIANDGKTVPGVFFWVDMVGAVVYFVMFFLVFLRFLLEKSGLSALHSIAFIISCVSILFINMGSILLDLLSGSETSYIIVPLMTLIGTAFFTLYVFLYRIIDIVHFALRNIFDHIADAIVVVDSSNRVLECNNAFANEFFEISRIKAESDFSNFFQCFEASSTSFNGELTLKFGGLKYFEVHTLLVRKHGNEYYGKIITFKDITEYRNLLTELEDKNTELMGINSELDLANEELEAANTRLNEYIAALEELSVSKVRNRVARDVNNSLSHIFDRLTTLIEKCRTTCQSDFIETEKNISTAINAVLIGLNELKRYISGLAYECMEADSIIHALENLILDYSSQGMDIDFSVENGGRLSGTAFNDTLYWICKEALTNSQVHGKARNVTVFLRCTENRVKLHIIDNGQGCDYLEKGAGLSGMEERVKEWNGRIIYGSGGEGGFNIYAEFPLG